MFGFQDICKRWLLLLVEFKLNFIYIYTSMAVYVTCQYTIIIYLLFISISWWLVTKMCNEWVDIIVLNLSLESSFRSAECANWKQPLDDWNQSYRIYISIYRFGKFNCEWDKRKIPWHSMIIQRNTIFSYYATTNDFPSDEISFWMLCVSLILAHREKISMTFESI